MPGLSAVFDAPRTAVVTSCRKPTMSLTVGSGLGLNLQPPVTYGADDMVATSCFSLHKSSASTSGCSSIISGYATSYMSSNSDTTCDDIDEVLSSPSNKIAVPDDPQFAIYLDCSCSTGQSVDPCCTICESCSKRDDVWKYLLVKPQSDASGSLMSLRLMVLFVPDEHGSPKIFRERLTKLIEHAEEDFNCSWLAVVINKNRNADNELTRALKFMGMSNYIDTSDVSMQDYIPDMMDENKTVMFMRVYEDESDGEMFGQMETHYNTLADSSDDDDDEHWEKEFFFR